MFQKLTVYREIFAAKKFSVPAKITHTNFFQQRNTVTVFLIQEVHCCLQYHSRQLLQQIKKWKKPSVPHLVGNVGHTGSMVDCSGWNGQVRLPCYLEEAFCFFGRNILILGRSLWIWGIAAPLTHIRKKNSKCLRHFCDVYHTYY